MGDMPMAIWRARGQRAHGEIHNLKCLDFRGREPRLRTHGVFVARARAAHRPIYVRTLPIERGRFAREASRWRAQMCFPCARPLTHSPDLRRAPIRHDCARPRSGGRKGRLRADLPRLRAPTILPGGPSVRANVATFCAPMAPGCVARLGPSMHARMLRIAFQKIISGAEETSGEEIGSASKRAAGTDPADLVSTRSGSHHVVTSARSFARTPLGEQVEQIEYIDDVIVVQVGGAVRILA